MGSVRDCNQEEILPWIQISKHHLMSLSERHKGADAPTKIYRTKSRKCSLEHIDDGVGHGKLRSTERFGCITEMLFFSKISVLNCVSEGGVNHSTLTPAKVASIAANPQNQLIMFYREVAEG